MSWSDRADDPLHEGHPEQPGRRRAASDGLFTARFWREAADRAVKTAAQALLLFWGGGDLFNAWEVNWTSSAGIALGGAVLSLATSLASAPFGDRASASAVRVDR